MGRSGAQRSLGERFLPPSYRCSSRSESGRSPGPKPKRCARIAQRAHPRRGLLVGIRQQIEERRRVRGDKR
jgi:hypothetical protein